MSYKTLGRIVKEVVAGTSQPNGYSSFSTSVKDVMYGPKKKVKDDDSKVEPAGDAGDIEKELDTNNQNIHTSRRASMERRVKILDY